MNPPDSPDRQMRPASVTIAVQTIWSVNAVSAVLLVLNGDGTETTGEYFALNAMLLILYALVTWQVGSGKNWARLTYAVLVALEIALIAAFGMELATELEALATYLTTPFEIWALYKLFTAESTQWFKRKFTRM